MSCSVASYRVYHGKMTNFLLPLRVRWYFIKSESVNGIPFTDSMSLLPIFGYSYNNLGNRSQYIYEVICLDLLKIYYPFFFSNKQFFHYLKHWRQTVESDEHHQNSFQWGSKICHFAMRYPVWPPQNCSTVCGFFVNLLDEFLFLHW